MDHASKINLLIASYLFYAAWNPPFVILLWISTVVDWYAAQGLVKARAAERAARLDAAVGGRQSRHARLLQVRPVPARQLHGADGRRVGVAYQPPHFDIVLPVGISFYTFATMSYTLDVYLRRAAPARNLLDYALFVTFFPHLVAGPDHASDRAGAAVRRSRAAPAATSCASDWR